MESFFLGKKKSEFNFAIKRIAATGCFFLQKNKLIKQCFIAVNNKKMEDFI